MSPERDKEFNQNMTLLLRLLKKILKNIPSPGLFPPALFQGKEPALNFNVFFFAFFPMTPEEMDEWEEIYDAYAFREERAEDELSTDLSPADIDFLRKNGIQF